MTRRKRSHILDIFILTLVLKPVMPPPLGHSCMEQSFPSLFESLFFNPPQAPALWAGLAFWILNISSVVIIWTDYHTVFFWIKNSLHTNSQRFPHRAYLRQIFLCFTRPFIDSSKFRFSKIIRSIISPQATHLQAEKCSPIP
jgi:hypothetical protein